MKRPVKFLFGAFRIQLLKAVQSHNFLILFTVQKIRWHLTANLLSNLRAIKKASQQSTNWLIELDHLEDGAVSITSRATAQTGALDWPAQASLWQPAG